jgi:hypothetical protein
MNKVVLLFVSMTLVALLIPLVCQGRSIQPPRCCNWNETTPNAQAISNQGVKSISDHITSSPEGLLAGQNMLSSGIPGGNFQQMNIQIVNHLYVTDRIAYLRMSIFRAAPPDLNWAFY